MKRIIVMDPFGAEWYFPAELWLVEDNPRNFTVMYRVHPDDLVKLRTFEKSDGFLWKELLHK